MLGNNFNKSKFYSGRNKEQIEFRKCLLSFGAESFVFQVAIQKFKDQDIRNYNVACCFVVHHIGSYYTDVSRCRVKKTLNELGRLVHFTVYRYVGQYIE